MIEVAAIVVEEPGWKSKADKAEKAERQWSQ